MSLLCWYIIKWPYTRSWRILHKDWHTTRFTNSKGCFINSSSSSCDYTLKLSFDVDVFRWLLFLVGNNIYVFFYSKFIFQLAASTYSSGTIRDHERSCIGICVSLELHIAMVTLFIFQWFSCLYVVNWSSCEIMMSNIIVSKILSRMT